MKWIIVIAVVFNGDIVGGFTEKTLSFNSQAACLMQVDEVVAALKKRLEENPLPEVKAILEQSRLVGTCINDGDRPREHNL